MDFTSIIAISNWTYIFLGVGVVILVIALILKKTQS
jgi:hypothetical protein